MSADFAACDTGTTQSPINLTGATPSDLPDPQFNYSPTPAVIENKGHTLQVHYAPGSGMTVGDARYQLVQFHFHTPSEHRLEGKEYPAALHLVHRGPNDQLAVVGVVVEEGRENPALRNLLEQLPQNKGETRKVDSAQINAEQLVPEDAKHFLYNGSLTTPPCTEGVTWMVMNKSIEVERATCGASFHDRKNEPPSAAAWRPQVAYRQLRRHESLSCWRWSAGLEPAIAARLFK